MSSRIVLRRRAPLLWAALIVAIGLLLGGLMLVPLARSDPAAHGRLVGQPALSLDAVDLDERAWSIEDGRGKLTWINFWATWCPPCRTEMPMMQRLSEQYGDRLLILGVNWAEERSTVEDFVERYAIDYPILLDPTLDNFYRWSPQFGLPRHYFVDARGIVVGEILGELPPAEMTQLLDELLGPQ
ncbi:MAG: TlpA family protein disulfide reductase [Chloroflexi bacterium]|nr:TlpA family protein disulfide reductase [Chloroflexota bacterium]